MNDSTAAQTAPQKPRQRPNRPQAVLEVIGKSRVTPNLLRVELGGPGLADLGDNDCTDKYVKLLMPVPGSGLVPPYDMDAIRQDQPDLLPRMRTYTVREWDHEQGRILIDFVLHPEADGSIGGLAAAWADEVLPGERIAMRGAGGGYAPDPEAPFHVLIGDHAALPAIASAVEALTDDARGTVLVQLDHEEDVQDLDTPEGVEVVWVLESRERLVDHVRELEIPEGSQLFVHLERGVTKEIRRHLVRERGIAKSDLSISAYWAAGRVEDQFQAEKREPIGRIDED
jgi:NADPH-dependent ferric siderophore reductase